jgi:hypothetical protein
MLGGRILMYKLPCDYTGIDFQYIPRPKENEVIVMTFDTEKWDIEQAW